MCPAICPSCCAPLFAFSVESDSFLSTLGVVPLACILQPIGPSPPPIFRIDAAIREPTGRASGGRTRRDSQRPCPSCLRTFLGWIKFGFHVDRLPLFVGRGCPWVFGEEKSGKSAHAFTGMRRRVKRRSPSKSANHPFLHSLPGVTKLIESSPSSLSHKATSLPIGGFPVCHGHTSAEPAAKSNAESGSVCLLMVISPRGLPGSSARIDRHRTTPTARRLPLLLWLHGPAPSF